MVQKQFFSKSAKYNPLIFNGQRIFYFCNMIKKPAILQRFFYAFAFRKRQSLYQRGLFDSKPGIEPEPLGCKMLKVNLLSDLKNVTRRIELDYELQLISS